jgi:hypothetical protein
MKSYGRSTVSEILGDQIVFRNLAPYDPRLPNLTDLREELSFPENFMPRKSMPEYGAVITAMLHEAYRIYASGNSPERIIYIGDTRMNDGQAFVNICNASGCEGAAFIGADRPGPVRITHEKMASNTVFTASRWQAIEQFEAFLKSKKFRIDENTAVLFDLDKTILGARGRNDKVIDMKRLEAANDTLEGALGADYHPEVFQEAYHTLNQPEFHAFTADNQDYLVYIGLIVSSGLISLKDLVLTLRAGNLKRLSDFLAYVEERKSSLPKKARELHSDVLDRFSSGDPTPFKTFRYNEFKRTVQHLGHLPDTAPVEQLLGEEIVITAEIIDFAKRCKAEGAYLFGLSDKPDEAILPTQELTAQGYLPIHHTPTHVIGEA